MPDLLVWPVNLWPPVMQGQTINWYHFVTELKQTHNVRVHHMAFGYATRK